jgi:hypothetical protein
MTVAVAYTPITSSTAATTTFLLPNSRANCQIAIGTKAVSTVVTPDLLFNVFTHKVEKVT